MSAVTRSPQSFSALLIIFTLVLPLAGQDDVPVYSSDVKVVNVLATVRDKRGNIVNTLTKEDFVLEEDGRPQIIKYFSRDTDLPLTLGLLVDTSLSQLSSIDEEKRASSAFARDILREGEDSAFLIHFDHEVELLQDITSSRDRISGALQDLRISTYSGPISSPTGGSGRRRGGPGGGTLLYDAIYLGSDEVLKKQQGRKAIIVLTDGVDHGSIMSLEQAIETAQRSDTIVYSIYFEGQEGGGGTWRQPRPGYPGGRRWPGPGYPGGRWPGGGYPPGQWPGGGGGYPGGGRYPVPMPNPAADGKKTLERLSRETGGRMFAVSSKDTIEKIYAQIEDELRNQYNLGYSPDRKVDNNSDYHRIRVATKDKDFKVQAREGYYSSRPLGTGATQ